MKQVGFYWFIWYLVWLFVIPYLEIVYCSVSYPNKKGADDVLSIQILVICIYFLYDYICTIEIIIYLIENVVYKTWCWKFNEENPINKTWRRSLFSIRLVGFKLYHSMKHFVIFHNLLKLLIIWNLKMTKIVHFHKWN